MLLILLPSVSLFSQLVSHPEISSIFRQRVIQVGRVQFLSRLPVPVPACLCGFTADPRIALHKKTCQPDCLC